MSSYLDNVFNGKNNLWCYLLTIIIAFLIQSFLSVYLGIGVSSFGSFFEYLSFYLKNYIFIAIGFGAFILFAVKYIHKRDVLSVINISNLSDKGKPWIRKIRWKNILKGIIIWGIFTGILEIALSILYPGSFVLNPKTNILFLIVSVLLVVPLQSVSEEIFFRGYLNQALNLKIKTPIFIILITSLIFAILHGFSLYYIFTTFLLGIILSIFTLIENGIETAMGIHIMNNVMAAIFLPATTGISSPNTIFMSINQIPITIDQATDILIKIILLVILIVYKRNDIKKMFKKSR